MLKLIYLYKSILSLNEVYKKLNSYSFPKRIFIAWNYIVVVYSNLKNNNIEISDEFLNSGVVYIYYITYLFVFFSSEFYIKIGSLIYAYYYI